MVVVPRGVRVVGDGRTVGVGIGRTEGVRFGRAPGARLGRNMGRDGGRPTLIRGEILTGAREMPAAGRELCVWILGPAEVRWVWILGVVKVRDRMG